MTLCAIGLVDLFQGLVVAVVLGVVALIAIIIIIEA